MDEYSKDYARPIVSHMLTHEEADLLLAWARERFGRGVTIEEAIRQALFAQLEAIRAEWLPGSK